VADYTAENVTEFLRQHRDVVRGHDAVHPDRNDCGGVGGCALMRAEHDAETRIVDALVEAARRGLRLAATQEPSCPG
jgi:hypothetical protein